MADIHPVPDPSMMAPVAGMDIQAPMEDLGGLAAAAEAAANARQPEALAILQSPPGAGVAGQNVTSGFTADWPADVEPGG